MECSNSSRRIKIHTALDFIDNALKYETRVHPLFIVFHLNIIFNFPRRRRRTQCGIWMVGWSWELANAGRWGEGKGLVRNAPYFYSYGRIKYGKKEETEEKGFLCFSSFCTTFSIFLFSILLALRFHWKIHIFIVLNILYPKNGRSFHLYSWHHFSFVTHTTLVSRTPLHIQPPHIERTNTQTAGEVRVHIYSNFNPSIPSSDMLICSTRQNPIIYILSAVILTPVSFTGIGIYYIYST